MEEVKTKKKASASKIALIIIGSILGIFILWLIIEVDLELKTEEKLIAMRDNILNTGEVDMSLETKGEYQKIERVMKEYYKEYISYYDSLYQNDYLAIYNLFTKEYLNNKTALPKLLQDLNSYQNNADEALDSMIKLLDEREIKLMFIDADIDYYHLDFYKELMILESDDETIKEWQNYKIENKEKMENIKKMLEILVNNEDMWYIEEDNLYINDEELLQEYNANYYQIFDNKPNLDVKI